MMPTLLILFGPTAIGKTDLSISLAKHFNSEIFSCDSRQFFKELEIGVAKPSKEQLSAIKHHFIDSISIFDHYSISKFEFDCIAELENYFKTHEFAIMCGGSGLYIDAVCDGVDEMPDHDPEIRKEVIKLYTESGIEALRFELRKIDPVFYEQVDLKNAQRIMRAIETYRQIGIPFSEIRKNVKIKRNFNIIKIGLNIDRNILYDRINLRVDKMFEDGLLEEAKSLFKYKDLIPLKTIGYREIFDFVENKISLEEAVEKIKINTRRYAKRQITWFKKYSDAKYFNPQDEKQIIEYLTFLFSKPF